MTIWPGGTVNLGCGMGGIAVQTLPAVIINGGHLALTAAPSEATRELLVTSLSISGSTNAWIGSVDLANNDLDAVGGSLANITNQVKQGYNGGAWNGAGGITSSTAAADTTHLTALGVIQNNQSGTAIYGSGANQMLFDGTAPGPSDVLVKYTYYGDANLDGKVDASDYSLIDNGYLKHLTGWYNGDFNYDGIVNGSDYTLIDNAYNAQGARLAASIASPSAISAAQIAGGAAAVPEPSLSVLLTLGTPALLARRSRIRNRPKWG
jgi:hypothetical protein